MTDFSFFHSDCHPHHVPSVNLRPASVLRNTQITLASPTIMTSGDIQFDYL